MDFEIPIPDRGYQGGSRRDWGQLLKPGEVPIFPNLDSYLPHLLPALLATAAAVGELVNSAVFIFIFRYPPSTAWLIYGLRFGSASLFSLYINFIVSFGFSIDITTTKIGERKLVGTVFFFRSVGRSSSVPKSFDLWQQPRNEIRVISSN